MQSERVTLPAARDEIAGYLARPEGDGPFPAVVVIHEVFGLNRNIREIADRFAEEGYVALAVDLYEGRNRVVCMARYFYGIFLNSLEHSGIQDLKALLSWLAARPEVDGERVGAIGFCMGGSFAIAWACTDPRLKVIAPFYGFNPRPLEAVARLCPVVGSYPEQDYTAGQARALDAALDRTGIPHEIKIYPGARHSFFNDHGSSHDAAASDDAWTRTMAFFSEHLTGTA